MKRRLACLLGLLLLVALVVPIGAQMQVQERVDLDAIFKIKDEGFQRSQVMEIMSYLTDVYGPRLTGSPQIKAAGEWARKKMMEWELVNVNLETWGPFGRGWSNERFSAMATSPDTFQIIGYPKAWTPGTNGAVTGDVVMAIINTDADMDKLRGKLRRCR